MSRRQELLYALNAGGVDPEAMARVDLEKMRLAGEHPISELLPKVLGPLTLRPGLENLYRVPGDAVARAIPFHRSLTASYKLLMTGAEMRVEQNGAKVQVPQVATAINSGSWSDVSTAPATASGGATLTLNGTAAASARLRQAVTVGAADRGKANILRVVCDPGPVVIRVGTSAGGQELMADTTLRTGTHKLAITPTGGTIYIEIRSDSDVTRLVTQIQFESTLIGGTGDLVLPTPWAATSLPALRWFRSKDILYIGDGVVQQRQIEHRGPQSWSVVKHQSRKGPYTAGNSKITMAPAALVGNTTITASENYFRSTHVGALIEVTSTAGSTVGATLTAVGQTSGYVTVTGVGTNRQIWLTTSQGGTFGGTLVLERSLDPGIPVIWQTFRTWNNADAVFAKQVLNDGQDNIRAHYRFKLTGLTSGTIGVLLEYTDGVAVGHALITGYTSPTQVSVEVTQAFGSTTASNSWRIGAWSDVLGWPRVPVIADDRLLWFRDDECFGSVVEDFTMHDDGTVGDSGPFIRTVGDGVYWASVQNRILIGTPSFEATVQASEIDTPITPTAFTVRRPSRRKSADIACAEHDDGVFFAQLSTRRIYELFSQSGDSKPTSQDITRLIPAGCRAGIVRMAVQQQPDTRLYTVLADGTCLVLTFDRDDKVNAFTTITTEGVIEDVCVLPNATQDDVHFIVRRNSTQRYAERLAPEVAQTDVATCALLDGHKVLTGGLSMTSVAGGVSTISGATHLAGQTVAVWADGRRRSDVVLDGTGFGTLDGEYRRIVYGRPYTARWKSVKLAYAAQLGTALGQSKRVNRLGVILSNSCLDGIHIGSSDPPFDPMPEIVDGQLRTKSQFFRHYDHELLSVGGDWNVDSRAYVTVNSAEGPCTLQALVLDVETREGVSAQGGN